MHKHFLPGRIAATIVLCWVVLGIRPAHAGGGPENVFLVVNPASAASQTVANYFQQIRGLPPTNVMYLDWRGSEARTDINTFRDKILIPILHELEAQGWRNRSITSCILPAFPGP